MGTYLLTKNGEIVDIYNLNYSIKGFRFSDCIILSESEYNSLLNLSNDERKIWYEFNLNETIHNRIEINIEKQLIFLNNMLNKE